MEKILFSAVPVLLMSLLIAPPAPLPIGSMLPKADIAMQDVSGKTVSLKDAKKENGLLVMFSCNTCPVVIVNQARTKAIASFALENNIGVILLNSNEGSRSNADSPEAMKKYADDQQYNWYYTIDKNNEVADAFGATRTPECFLFDKQGKLVYHGAIDDNPQDVASVKREHLREAINEMKKGDNVSVAVTKSVGCGIKRKK
jgi:peroxiredoxin